MFSPNENMGSLTSWASPYGGSCRGKAVTDEG